MERRRWKESAPGIDRFEKRACVQVEHFHVAGSVADPDEGAVGDQNPIGPAAVRAARADEICLELVCHRVGCGVDDVNRTV